MLSNETLLYQPTIKNADAIPIGWLYPAPYTVAISSLGYLSLFKQLDMLPTVHPVRIDSDNITQHNPQNFELIGVSFAFELDILELLKQFETWQFPFLAADRSFPDCPLIFAGGPAVTTNPEPYAEFIDFFIIGDGEDALPNLITAYKTFKNTHASTFEKQDQKTELLKYLALTVPGLYVPSLYEVTYHSAQSEITRIEPKYPDVPQLIQRQSAVFENDHIMTTPILSEQSVFGRKFLIEVMRGCPHRCRFCLASYSTLPAKGPENNALVQALETGLQHTQQLGLLGALITEHPDFENICDILLQKQDVTVSTASLRADAVTPKVAQMIKHTRQNTVTIAVESGSEKIRHRINKHLKTDSIFRAAEHLSHEAILNLKLYFMVGLPDETPEDIDASITLIASLKKQFPKLSLQVGCSTFVPKAQTPFQWKAREQANTLEKKQEQFRRGIYKYANFRPSSPKWDALQAILSRGDRRLTPFIIELYRHGGKLGSMNRALKNIRQQYGQALPFPELDWYGSRERQESEVLPWEHLNLGVSKAILFKEGR